MATLKRQTRDVIAVGVIALLVRIPAFFAPQPLGFDDGQFAMSVIAMRHGGLPFRQVFSSQGPLFLPIAWLGDLLTFQRLDSPRAASVVAGVVLAILILLIGRRLTTPGAALMAAVFIALSGSVLWTTGPLTSDGIGEAFTAGTVLAALVYWRRPTWRRAIVVGLLAGLALAVKSLLVIPGLAAAGVWMLLQRRVRDLLLVPVVAVATILVVSLPWGLSNVYDQYVRYHTDAVADRPIGANFSKLARTLFERDAPLLVAAVVALLATVAVVMARRRAPAADAAPSLALGRDETFAPWYPMVIWFVAIVVVVLTESPMWRNHVAHVVVPLALLVGIALRAARPRAIAVVLAVLVAPWSIIHLGELIRPHGPTGLTGTLEHRLQGLPAGALAISDTPGLVWRAGLRVPDKFVDVSILRITSPTKTLRLTGDDIVHAAARPDVCAVVRWSGDRFTKFPHLADRLTALGYRSVISDAPGPKVLWVKQDCHPR
ncbi:MAG: glycosyltransferase family 39 protein [Acidimicrobiia bacterium]